MYLISSVWSLSLALSVQYVSAGGNDWVNPAFVLKKSGAPDAEKTIISYAKSSASKGPWTVYGGDTSILPPDKDKRDYLSWAPYHWPACNWCQGGQAHLSTGRNRTNPDEQPNNGTWLLPAEDGGDVEYGDNDAGDDDDAQDEEPEGDNSNDSAAGAGNDDGAMVPFNVPSPIPYAHRKMMKRARRFTHTQKRAEDENQRAGKLGDDPLQTISASLPTALPTAIPGFETESATTDDTFGTSESGVENARKTTKTDGKTTHKAAPTKTQGSGSNCTPSPTKSLAPSATWTTCKYVVRDGKLNPDVRMLHGVEAIADASQSIIYNAIASVLTGTASYAQSAAQAINVFFLDAQTGMHPRIPYGQVIRGPQTQTGQYLGVLDFRGMVKVANAILIMQAAKMPAWTASLNTNMKSWTTEYLKWLQTSAIGKQAISAPNNHGTFAANQLASMNILAGDDNAATNALKSYFMGQFLDQIAASGEQPFEAVRTRPFHYRCFNLEAMITNAKLGGQLGSDFWNAKSKYGATIKDALDFVMKKGPGKEDVADIFPHVAAIAAVYGDPGGKYMAYLKNLDSHFMTAPYYYYDQPTALSQKASKEEGGAVNDAMIQQPSPLRELDVQSTNTSDIPYTTPSIPWKCPEAFATALRVQLDDGVFVTCDQLKPFYGYVEDEENQV